MNRKIEKLSCLTLTLMIVLSSAVVLNNAAAQARPKIFIDPANNEFLTTTKHVNDTFMVNIVAADWGEPGVYSWQSKLTYDKILLAPVKNKTGMLADNWISALILKETNGTIANGEITFASTMTGEDKVVGGGILAFATFKIIAGPPVGESVGCDLALTEVIIVNPTNLQKYPDASYDVIKGTYKFTSPPPPKPSLKVSSVAWDNTAADAAGRLFTITVSIQDLEAQWHAVAIQFKLEYNATLMETKEAWIYKGDFLSQFGLTFNISLIEEGVLYGEILLPSENGQYPDPADLAKYPQGSGVLATIQFNATYRPPPPVINSPLVLRQVLIVDYQSKVVPYEQLINGTYTISVAPPAWLSVDPRTFTFEKIGSQVDLKANLNEIDKGFRLVGTEFKVRYNTTFLTIASITEGSFLKDFATGAGIDTFFQAYIQEDYGLIGIIILPLSDGTWPEEAFPQGTGTLATLTFEAIFQLQTEDVTTNLVLYDALLVDADAKVIPTNEQKTIEEGTCVCTIKQAYVPPPIPPAERSIDLFTQYDSPYGGQGAGVPSDAFAPQGQVKLFASVTYRGEGVPSKAVAYQIRGPKGDYLFDTRFSGADGLALLDFSIPASETFFGVWNVAASVDIAGQVVSDYVIFKVGWLVSTKEILVTSDGTITDGGKQYPLLLKGHQYTAASTLKVITMQPPEKCVQLQGQVPKVLMVYTGFDELGQPLFSQYAPLFIDYFEFSGVAPTTAEMTAFVLGTGRDFETGTSTISIPSSAFSGIGTIYGNVFTEFPWVKGVPYAPSTLGMKKVWIKAVAAPPQPPKPVSTSLSIQTVTVKSNTKPFNVPVNIKDVDPAMKIVGLQFEFTFDKTLLSVVDVTAGDFISGFGETFITWVVDGNVLVGELLLPDWPGPNGWMSGSGTVANIKFQPKTMNGGTFVTLIDSKTTFLVDNLSNKIVPKSVQPGFVSVEG